MQSRLRYSIMLLFLGGWIWADTEIVTDVLAVKRGDTVEVTVHVSCPTLRQLQVYLALPSAGVALVPGSEWLALDRFADAFEPELKPTTSAVFNHEPGGDTVQFWLNQDPFSSWRITAGSGPVFGFFLEGIGVGTWDLEVVQASARNTSMLYPDEAVQVSIGSITVYIPPEPIVFTPAGGSFNEPQVVTLSAEHAEAIYYTIDGSEPDHTAIPYDGAFSLDLPGGGSVLLKAIAYGGGPSQVVGEVVFDFDYQPPTVSITPLITNDTSPLLSGSIDDAGAAIEVALDGVRYAVPNPGDGTWQFQVPVVLAEGVYEVGVSAVDSAGNRGEDSTVDELEIDTTPPGGSFHIMSGDPEYATTAAVQLANTVTGAVEMRYRNRDGAWSDWTGIAAAFPWILPGTDGEKQVDAEFRDLAGNVLLATDSVILDTQGPVSTISTAGAYGVFTWPGEISGTAADLTSGVASVSLLIRRQETDQYWDGAAWQADPLWLLASGRQAWSYGLSNAALSGGGTLDISSRSRDWAGLNEALPATRTITYDDTPPAGTFAIGSGNPTYATTTAVELVIAVTGATEMRFRNAGSAWDAAWLPIAVSHPWNVPVGDGLRVVEAQFRDASLNSLELSDSIILDTTPPVSSISSSGGFGPDSWPGAVSGTADDGTSGVSAVLCQIERGSDGASWDGASWSGDSLWLVATLGRGAWSLSLPVSALSEGGDGVMYTVRSQAEDAAGNLQADVTVASFVYDSSVPAGSFWIGAGNPLYTNSRDVVLYNSVHSDNDLEMCFAEEGGPFSAWVAHDTEFHGLELSNSDGVKRVQATFRDMLSGNTLQTSDSIILDRVAPNSAIQTTGTFGPATWPQGVEGTAADERSGVAQVSISILRASDGAYWDGAAFVVSAQPLFTLATGRDTWFFPLSAAVLTDDTTYVVQSRAQDGAGNLQSDLGQRTIRFDSSPPSGSFSIGAGAPSHTTTTQVMLEIAVTGAVEMSFRNVGGAYGGWEAYAASRTWSLPGGDGTKVVEGRFRDAAGNIQVLSDSIVLDAVAPISQVGMVDRYGPNTWSGGVFGTAEDAVSGVSVVWVAIARLGDGRSWNGAAWQVDAAWLAAAGTTAWSLPLPAAALLDGEVYRVRSRAEDAAGNAQDVTSEEEFRYDASAPAGSFTIGAEDPAYTSTRDVFLFSQVSDAVEMRFAHGAARGSFGPWEPYAPEYAWQLAPGDGDKVVRAQYRDTVWNVLEVSDAVMLDQTAPVSACHLPAVAGPQTWSGHISGTAVDASSGVASVTITIQRLSDAAFWNGTQWDAAASPLPAVGTDAWSYALAPPPFADGDVILLQSQARDAAGNIETPPVDLVFTYDALPPAGGFAINDGALYCNQRSVALQMAVAGAAEMRFRNAADSWDEGGWVAYANTLPWQLADLDGERSVVGQFRDAVHNVAEYTVGILLDRSPPSASVATSGMQGKGTWPDAVQGTAADEGSGVETVEVRVLRGADFQYWNGTDWQASEVWVEAVGTETWSVALPFAKLDHQTSYGVAARARDAAANAQLQAATGAFTVDNVGPVQPVAIPAGGLCNVSVEVQLTVAADAAETYYTLDGSVPDTTSARYAGSILVEAEHGHTLQLAVLSYDAWGNPGVLLIEAYTFDTEAPTGYSLALQHPSLTYRSVEQTGFTILDGELGAAYAYGVFSLGNGRAVLEGSGTITDAVQEIGPLDLSLLDYGDFAVRLELTDAAGNRGAAVEAGGFREEVVGVSVTRGWNLVGLPLSGADTVAGFFAGRSRPGAGLVGPIWFWSGSGYDVRDGDDPLPLGEAFWLLWDGDEQQVEQRGIPLHDSLPSNPGWHLFSPPIPRILADARGVVSAWAWHAGRSVYHRLETADVLQPGQGYWLYVAPPAE